jgi:hypothetical protein
MADVNFQVKKGLTVPNGSASAPSVIFDSADTNTGIYSPGADQVAISTGGTARLTSSTTGITSALPVNVPLGTDSAPSVTFTGDLNTGIYSPGADQVAISTNSAGRLFIDSSGRVGIGDAAPESILHLKGSSATLKIESSVNTGYSGVEFDRAADDTHFAIYAYDSSHSTQANNVQFYGYQNGSLSFHTNSAERMRLDSSGRLGLGTSVPSMRTAIYDTNNNTVSGANIWSYGIAGLQIRNLSTTANTMAGVYFESGTLGGSASAIFNVQESSTSGALAFATGGSGSNSVPERMRIDSSGRVGIGTTTVGDLLHLRAATTPHLRIDHTTTSSFGAVQFYEDTTQQAAIGALGSTSSGTGGGNALQIWNFLNAPTVFATNNTERARIDSSGRLLVGTSTAPSAGNSQYSKLVVQANTFSSTDYGILNLQRGLAASSGITGNIGSINFSDNAGNEFALIQAAADGTTGSSDYPGRLVFSTTADGASSPTERMRIHADGVTTIGKSSQSTTVAGIVLQGDGFGGFTRSASTVGVFNRQTDDGVIISLVAQDAEEGTISVSGNTVSYNQFLGAHWSALSDWSRPEIKIGTILETINELTDWKYAVIEVEGKQKKICYNGTTEIGSTVTVEYEGEEYEGIVELETDPEFNKAVKIKVNDTAASKAVYGVFVGWNNDSNGDGGIWNDMYVGAVGNYVIRMAEGQEPEIGDLVEADGTGCAVVQADDIIRTKTVAKITSTIPQVTYDDGSFLVTCVLYCG